MAGFTHKDLTDIMLENADATMEHLCAETLRGTGRNEFTSQQFLKHIVRLHPDAYVQLLERCRIHFPDYIFNKAHECIGREIARRAEKAGYSKSKEGSTETDIFDNPTGKVVYRPHNA